MCLESRHLLKLHLLSGLMTGHSRMTCWSRHRVYISSPTWRRCVLYFVQIDPACSGQGVRMKDRIISLYLESRKPAFGRLCGGLLRIHCSTLQSLYRICCSLWPFIANLIAAAAMIRRLSASGWRPLQSGPSAVTDTQAAMCCFACSMASVALGCRSSS